MANNATQLGAVEGKLRLYNDEHPPLSGMSYFYIAGMMLVVIIAGVWIVMKLGMTPNEK